MGIANAFSGGIFLAIALLHIIPESHTHYLLYMHKDEFPDNFEKHEHMTSSPSSSGSRGVVLGGVYRNLHGIDSAHKLLDLGFPLPYFMAFLGYTMILLIDKVMFDSHSSEHEHEIRESFRSSVVEKRGRSNSHDHKSQGNTDLVLNIAANKLKYEEFKDEDEDAQVPEAEEFSEGIRKFLSTTDRFSKRMGDALSKKYKRGAVRGQRDVFKMKSNTGTPVLANPFGTGVEDSSKDDDVIEGPSKGIH